MIGAAVVSFTSYHVTQNTTLRMCRSKVSQEVIATTSLAGNYALQHVSLVYSIMLWVLGKEFASPLEKPSPNQDSFDFLITDQHIKPNNTIVRNLATVNRLCVHTAHHTAVHNSCLLYFLPNAGSNE